ncbi:MAG: HU family DNA-binding protein [bacterium JZ-2024 1]
MNKGDMVKAIAQKAGLSQKAAAAALDAFISTVTSSLSKKEAVRLVGFGTFEVRRRAARKGVVPGTKKPINIPARNVPVFRVGAKLKSSVR